MNTAIISCILVFLNAIPAKSLRFIVVGDWGSRLGRQDEVAMAMGNWSADREQDFVLSVGDNFYTDGVTSVNDTQFDTTWSQIYMDKKGLQIPWYIMAGNHDHYGNIQAQIEYSQVNPMWHFPSLYYKLTTAAGNATVDIIVYDTEFIETDREQQEWLLESISTSTADWIIVAAHAPIYSSGMHGVISQTWWVETNIRPLLEQYNVAFYLSGHDHDQQHITKYGSQVDYMITGGGSSARSIDPKAIWALLWRGACLKWRKASLGFVELEIQDNTATVQFVNENGEVIYSFTKNKC